MNFPFGARQRLAPIDGVALHYGYGVVGGHLTRGDQDAARLAEGAHRARRDALLVRLTAAKVTPPAAQVAYSLLIPG